MLLFDVKVFIARINYSRDWDNDEVPKWSDSFNWNN